MKVRQCLIRMEYWIREHMLSTYTVVLTTNPPGKCTLTHNYCGVIQFVVINSKGRTVVLRKALAEDMLELTFKE